MEQECDNSRKLGATMSSARALVFAIFYLLPAAGVLQGQWQEAEPLHEGRRRHAATLLTSGKVLVAGGSNSLEVLSRSEIFDPGGGGWEAAASLASARYNHTATLLPSGNVLVAGGGSSAYDMDWNSAEIFDSRSGSWRSTGSMAGARKGHTATLLHSGELLVVGGNNNGSDLASAEIYNEALDSWHFGGQLTWPRSAHTATLLKSGRVLVTGGRNGNNALGTAELYDPARGWSSLPSLGTARYGHTATLLGNGKVLIAGGETGNGAVTTSCELFDPDFDPDHEENAWQDTGGLSWQRYQHTATLLLTGEILVAGGYSSFLTESEIFDPVEEVWRPGGALSAKRFLHTATLLPAGQVMVVGGGFDSPASVEIFNSTGSSWAPVNAAFAPRSNFSATLLLSGKVLIAGGAHQAQQEMVVLRDAELFNPLTRDFDSTGSLVIARAEHSATLLPDGKVLVVGGRVQGERGLEAISSAEIYCPETGAWREVADFGRPVFGHSATLLPSGKVLVVGGGFTAESAGAALFVPETETWQDAESLSRPRIHHSATLLPSGSVLVAGGNPSALAEIYDPSTDLWSDAGFGMAARSRHAAALLPSGKVLIAGGQADVSGLPLTSSEVFDPETRLWQATGVLNSGRILSSRAVVLPDGNVLMVGGGGLPEVYDSTVGNWTVAGDRGEAAVLLQSGGVLVLALQDAWIFETENLHTLQIPRIESVSAPLRYGAPISIGGTGFRSAYEGSSGNSGASAVNYPLIQLMALDGTGSFWLPADPRPNFWDEPMTLEVSDLPPAINPGRHLLTVVVGGVRSEPVPVDFECSLAITGQPSSPTVALGQTATFSIKTQGGRRFQWRQNGVDIPGATASSYTTAPVTAADAGTTYSVFVDSLCATATSSSASLIIADHAVPTVDVIEPNGGEYWPLSGSGTPNTRLVTWRMADNIRICQVQVGLLYSTNSGQSWLEASGNGLPAVLGQAGPCAFPGVQASSFTYAVPAAPPSGAIGSLYKIRLRVTDQAGNMAEALSANPFFIVQPNPDSIKTLILHNLPRMRSVQGISLTDSGSLANNLLDLANHPRVLGRLVDLSLDHDLAGAYAAWDAASEEETNAKANAVVAALRNYLRVHLLPTYTGVESLVIVGDDRIVPMARLVDATQTPESTYTSAATGSLTTASTVGKALSRNYYLSDDLLGIRHAIDLPVGPDAFAAGHFIPTLAVGRLVESPTEITKTIATFISKDGVLDLGALANTSSHKVLVTGYDFLVDSATRISKSWQQALWAPSSPLSVAPVDGQLISSKWGSETVAQRRNSLRDHLSGNGGASYGINSLNGHSTHFEEGVPGASSSDIQGLSTAEIYGPHSCGGSLAGIDLPGAVVYAIGCHGGLPVPGSCISDSDHSLDLPQTMMARGAVAYIANSGYGWGIKYGIGVSERLVQIFSEELMSGGTVNLGDVVLRSKLRYFIEQPGFDVYDQKTLLQWTYYGLPMYSVQTGIAAAATPAPWTTPPPVGLPGPEQLGAVKVTRRAWGGEPSALPDFLISLSLSFDLSAFGVYRKYDSVGNLLDPDAPCPATGDGCYYTLNELVERGSGTPDLPIQPYFVYDSRISGTSQHGVLWLGGAYREESGWRPVIAELVTNHGDYSNHGSAPRLIHTMPLSQRIEAGDPTFACPSSDLELNSLVAVVGEALKTTDTEPTYSRQRLFQNMDLEALYFNDQGLGNNCDRHGPLLGPGFGGSYHQTAGARIDWAVEASDPGEVWRVVVVYDLGPDASGNGRWQPVELTADGNGTWRGSAIAAGAAQVTYMIQAADRRGNVEWVDFVAADLPASGVPPGLAMPFDVSLAAVQADLRVQVSDAPDPVATGGVLVYTVAVANSGPSPANTIRVVDVLPRGVSYGAAAGQGWSCQHQEGTVTCTLPALGLSAAPPLSIFVFAPPAPATLTSSVTVSALEADPAPSNNNVLVQTFVTDQIFADGFESGDATAWFLVIPP